MLEKGLTRAVARDDAGALLPAMLQREEAVVGQDRGIRMAEDARRRRTRAAGMLRVLTILGAGGRLADIAREHRRFHDRVQCRKIVIHDPQR